MPKHSWPAAVTSWEDTVKFAQLLLGMDARLENYADRLPRSSTNSFLLFAKGACKAPRPLSGIANVIPAQLSEIKNYEIGKRRNFHNPLKSQQMLARKGALCQWLILKYHVFFGMSIWTNSNRQIIRPWRDIWWLKSTGWKWEDGYGSTPDPCAPPESWVWYSLSVYTYIIVHYSAYNILYLFVLNVMYRMFVWCELNAMSCFKDSRWWANSIGFDSMISAYHSIIFPKIMQLWPFASYKYLQPHSWNLQSHV